MINNQLNDKEKEQHNELVFSYLTLRNLIGLGGMLLPVLLAAFPSRSSDYFNIEPSISDYFYTDRGDILVVMLCIIGAFLITYVGYTYKEMLLTTIAGIGGIGVAFVPTRMACEHCLMSVHTDSGGVFKGMAGTGWHFGFAVVFLLSLAIMSLVYFTKSAPGAQPTANKVIRDRVHKTCGWIMLASLIVLGAYFLFEPDTGRFPTVYFFETVAVEAFGFSWLVKGQTLWPDGEHYLAKGVRDVKKAMQGDK